MCVFCAAIPLTAAAGASLHRKQQKQNRMMSQSINANRSSKRPSVGKATAAAITLLLVCSVVYHTHYGI